MTRAPTSGLVLAGASALGAYEVGVLSYLYESVLPEAASEPTVFCGTSAGAINATAVAAHVDEPLVATSLLIRTWREIELESVLQPSLRSILAMLLDVTGAPSLIRHAPWLPPSSGIVANAPIARLVDKIPFGDLAAHVARGDVRGVAVTATRVSDGGAAVFFASHARLEGWGTEPNVQPTPATLTAKHVLASSAIPLLFPAVTIGDEVYCDGGVRQMVPLSPAFHLGAERVLVINPLPSVRHASSRPASASSPLYLAGKALNALFADRLEVDLANARRTTAILRAGEARFGPGFRQAIDEELVGGGAARLQPLDTLCIEPTLDLGALAADHVRSPAFKHHSTSAVATLVRRVADGEPERMGDLLAYVLFDAGFLRLLIEAGRQDARARHAELVTWFSPS